MPQYRGVTFSTVSGPATHAEIDEFERSAGVVLPLAYRDFLQTIGGGQFENGYVLPLSAAGRTAEDVNRDGIQGLRDALEYTDDPKLADWNREMQKALELVIETEPMDEVFPLQSPGKLSVAKMLQLAKKNYLFDKLRCIPIGAGRTGGITLWMGTGKRPNSGIFSWSVDWDFEDEDDVPNLIEQSLLGHDFDDFLSRILPEPFVVPDENQALDYELLRRLFPRD